MSWLQVVRFAELTFRTCDCKAWFNAEHVKLSMLGVQAADLCSATMHYDAHALVLAMIFSSNNSFHVCNDTHKTCCLAATTCACMESAADDKQTTIDSALGSPVHPCVRC